MSTCLKTLLAAALTLALPLAAQKPAQPSGAVQQGIHVSGYWKIDIRNADGSLAKHVEFENALTSFPFSASALGAQSAVGPFAIEMTAGSGDTPCNTGSCYLYQNTYNNFTCFSGRTCFNTLTETVANATIQLAGSFTATRNGNIGNVYSVITMCPATYTTNACRTDANAAQTNGAFTSFALPSPVTIASGQIVQVSVTISFS